MFNKIWGKVNILVLLVMVMALLGSHKVMAQAVDQAGNRLEATLGGQDSAKNYRVQCDTTGLCESAVDTSWAWGYENIGSGTSVPSSSGNPGTGYQLSSTDAGLNIADYGGKTAGVAAPGTLTGSGTRYLLPTCNSAALGLYFDVSTSVKETITITPYSTSDSLGYSISGIGLNAGQGIKNSGSGAAGDSIQIECTSPGNWTMHNLFGTWATSA